MSVIWNKVWHDLWHNKGRTILAIMSIAAGVFAVGTIFGMVDQLLTGMDSAHRAVQPAHINIILRNYINQEIVDDLKQIDGVVDIEPVNQISVRYKWNASDEWELGTLVMRPDYEEQTYDQIILKDGQWPSNGELGLERLTGQYSKRGIGDQVILKVGEEEQTFTINGSIRHPFVQPPLFGGQAHFFTDAEGLEEFGIPDGAFGQLLARVEPYSLERAQEVAGEIRAQLGEKSLGVIVTLYQDPELHWGRMFVEGINLVLQIMAVVSLYLSVVLVLNTLTALITQQTDQIGAIKAIGGRTGTITRAYLSGVAVYGLLALLIALPLSLATAYESSRWFLNLFNIDYETFQVSQRAIVLQIIAALVVPVLAALIPVLKGAAITVREAISSYGIGADFGSSWLDRGVERVAAKFLPSLYAAALANLFRRKARLLLSVTVLVVAGTTFLVIMSLISSTSLTLDNDMARRGYDLRIGFNQSQPLDQVRELALNTPGVLTAEPWYSRNATILRAGERLQDSAGLGAQLIGIPTNSNTITPIITSGRWIESGESARSVVISQETATANNIQTGDVISLDLGELGAEEWSVVGTYRVVYGSGFVIEPIYAPLEAVYDVIGSQDVLTQILLRTDQIGIQEHRALAESLKTIFEDSGMSIDLYTTNITLEERDYANNQFNSIISVLLSLAMVMASVGGIGLMGSLGISVVERRREIGVLRAIGASNAVITRMFILESLFQALLAWLLTVPLAYATGGPLARLLGQTMIEVDLDYAFNLPAVFIWLVVLIVIAMLASSVPARDATRVSVRESLNYA